MATTFGLSDQGLVVKRLSDILTDQRAKATLLFQDLVAPGDVVDTSDSSLLGRLIALDADGDAVLWQQLQEVYTAFDPNSATGYALDNLVALGGITRQSQTFSTAQVLLSGDNGITIASGLTVGSSVDSSQWTIVAPVALNAFNVSGATFTALTVANNTAYTITYATVTTSNTISYTSGANATAATIAAGIASLVTSSHPSFTATVANNSITLNRVDEFATVNFTTSNNLGITDVTKIGEVISTSSGPVTAEPNTLTKILTPQLGWDSVTNPIAASVGRDLETDEELRVRFRDTKFERASNIIEALYSALLNLSGVEEVRIYENDTDATNEFNVPAHSFMPIVLGGLSSQIANSIWENKPMGIRSFGSTVVVIYDSQGFAHNIGFKRPDPVPVYITLNLSTDSSYPATGDDDIRSDLTAYIDKLRIGDDVVYSRLYTPINNTSGFQINSMYIGTSANPTGTSNVVVNFDQIATLSSANIIINR